jgi:hypothetical protein
MLIADLKEYFTEKIDPRKTWAREFFWKNKFLD